MSLPTIVYDMNTDAAGNGTLVTQPLVGWLSEIQVTHNAGADGTLIFTADFNGVTETLLTVKGSTSDTYHVSRPILDNAAADTGSVGYWNLTGQIVTAISTANGALLSPASEIKFGGSR